MTKGSAFLMACEEQTWNVRIVLSSLSWSGVAVFLKLTAPPEGRGVLNLSLGRGCRPDLETLTLFIIKSS